MTVGGNLHDPLSSLGRLRLFPTPLRLWNQTRTARLSGEVWER
jgi:hypothetical protein